LKKSLIVAIKQGGTADATIDGVNEMIDSMINRCNFFIADWFSGEEMAGE
jgi:hypothetical protein